MNLHTLNANAWKQPTAIGGGARIATKTASEIERMSADNPKRGRPPIAGETATGQIQLRTTMERKNAYVRAAKPKKLTAWIFEQLDKAAGYEPTEQR